MPEINLNFTFSSKTAEEFVNCSKRNICWNSGYGAGKTYAAMQKILLLMLKFPNYRVAVGRYSNTELRRTTMQTFYKLCPPELYDEKIGGKRVESNPSYVRLFNGSQIYWMHFDEFDESALRSLEINAAVIDQAEEVPESVYLTLDSRVGRWDQAVVPEDLLKANPNWPRNKFTGKPLAPAYMIILCNPPDEGEFSYIWQRYHPDSPEHQKYYKDTHAYFESASFENKALPEEVLQTMLTRDPEWVNRYVLGKFSKGEGAIHDVSPLSLISVGETLDLEHLQVTPEWIQDNIISTGILSLSLDHGASSPTACTWWASLNGNHYCYREYYQPNQVISYHRKRIAELCPSNEHYSNYLADPAIFKKTQEKYGGFWTVADEYLDPSIEGRSFIWTPADNNELSTRNRINELLRVNKDLTHPITGLKGSPRLFFFRKSLVYPNGCDHLIREISAQKKKLLDTVNGRPIYSDEREKSISDHAYDTLRYYISYHITHKEKEVQRLKPNSFKAVQNRIKALKHSGYFDIYGVANAR
ncbi:MAG: hypothetical protein ACUVQP_00045 [Bacteroidales bacterium]